MAELRRAEIISTGHEIVTGEVVNTNATWLAEQLSDLGMAVVQQTVVDDEGSAIGDACRMAAQRADVVIVTGGLGPTADDLTLEAAAAAFACALQMHAGARQQVEEYYLRRGAVWNEKHAKMALLPEGAEPLHNDSGSAPGVRAYFNDTEFIFLPGVPHEMEQIFREHVRPSLHSQVVGTLREVRIMKCCGADESKLETRLEQLPLSDVQLGFRIAMPEVAIKLIADGHSRADVAGRLSRAEELIRQELGDLVYGAGKETLAGVVGAKLIARQATVAVAESCTGGLLANYLTDVPGSSNYFNHGFITYSNEAKTELLGVPRKLLSVEGAVSAPVVEAMALGLRERSGADYTIAITGIAGPGGGSELKPRGTVYIALASAQGCLVAHRVVARPRREFKHFVASLALDMLRKTLG